MSSGVTISQASRVVPGAGAVAASGAGVASAVAGPVGSGRSVAAGPSPASADEQAAIAIGRVDHERVGRKVERLERRSGGSLVSGKGDVDRFLGIDPARFAGVQPRTGQGIERTLHHPLPKSVMRD